ncbi:MAG: ribosome-binding factor A [Candidatus Omnitrophica bacterium 4484_70.1]|nr:MAG: ribosome-binding factor A [Candidatus Omnitrophica bacterium 4484_70.1]
MSYRLEKVNSQIKKEITKIIQEEIDDPRVEMVSITRVVTRADLREAHIYFSVLKEEEAKDVSKILNRMRGYLRRILGRKMRIKILPSLRFFPDDTIRYSVEIYRKIEEIMHGEKNNSVDKRE